ncbi:hypothetical protein L1276_002490 [Flavobacterium sp. HSC-32F16]|uniref:hypothetical protein n=1 Tax=Flavobacterium sp. HSC-32F16 TaxID=2910964 RepID=UPI0020A58B7C|nr:hypothetical protein [Flavobacterium sp. HSC-32F16]MCP2027333.1 hypothetical protein [Flavobacterium sp. HSC-32F16]
MKQLSNPFLNLAITFWAVLFFVSCQKKSENSNNVSIEKKTILQKKSSPIDNPKNLKEEVLLNYIDKATTIKPNSKNGVPFDKLDYDKVIAYDFDGSEETYPKVIDKHGKFVPVVLAQKVLSQIQADKILSTLTKKSTYGEGTAACFKPHFAIIFYKQNKAVNQISICLDCNYLISDIDIPAETYSKVNKGTPEEYSLIGFTKSGKAAIISLSKELGFYYQQKNQ